VCSSDLKDCRLFHNTIHDPQNRLSRLIRTVFTNDGLVIANNLLSGPGMRNESDSNIKLTNNLIKDMPGIFADPNHGNLHLMRTAEEAIDKAAALPEVNEDIDAQRRDAKPDIGADELARPQANEIRVTDSAGLRAAVGRLTPGKTLLLEPGVYQGGLNLQNATGNRFERCMAPIAWVSADGGHVHHNTIILPDRWVLRILQETSDPQFRPCHGQLFEHNVVIYDSQVQVFVNVGPRTAPETFVFRHNVWCDTGSGRKPVLPVAEEDGVYLSNVGAEAYKRIR
jgi:hypothetical protein